MEWYYDQEDFYNEPSEFDQQIDEFKSNLLKAVKEEYINEMEQLRKENAELQEVKKNFKQIQQDYDNKKRDLEIERNDLNRKVRRERLSDLFKDHQVILYKAYSSRVLPQKCDKCDDYRRVEYTSPLGRKTKEDCLCKEGKVVYNPQEFIRYEFRLNRDKNSIVAWYRTYDDSEDGFVSDSSIHVEKIYTSDMKFEELSNWSTFFKTEEECQAYCDYLTKKEESK